MRTRRSHSYADPVVNLLRAREDARPPLVVVSSSVAAAAAAAAEGPGRDVRASAASRCTTPMFIRAVRGALMTSFETGVCERMYAQALPSSLSSLPTALHVNSNEEM